MVNSRVNHILMFFSIYIINTCISIQKLTRYSSNSGTTDCCRRRRHLAILPWPSSCRRYGSDAGRGRWLRLRRRKEQTPVCRWRLSDGLRSTRNQCRCRRDTTTTTSTTKASCPRRRRIGPARSCCPENRTTNRLVRTREPEAAQGPGGGWGFDLTRELAAAVAAELRSRSCWCCSLWDVVCRWWCDGDVPAVVADNKCRRSGGRQAASSSPPPPSEAYFRVKPPYCLAIDGVGSPVLLTRLEPIREKRHPTS